MVVLLCLCYLWTVCLLVVLPVDCLPDGCVALFVLSVVCLPAGC